MSMLSPASKTRLKTYFISKQSPVHGDLFLLNEIQKALSIVEEVKKELVEKMDTIKAISKGDKGDSIVGPQGERGDKGESGKNGKDGRTPIAGIDFPFPKNGKDGESIVGPAGRDADIKELEKNLPQFGRAFRDGLELLPDGEKLKIEATEGLREELDKMKTKKGGVVYVGGGSSSGGHIVKVYSLSSQLNGVLKTFSLPAFWRVLNVHSTSFPNSAFEPTTDYTTDGSVMTITFTAQIDAPTVLAAGQTLLIEYAES